ncbi:hypothetical protein [Peribacillus phoenicis]|uniref:hypothetical protein n=1 Tax=unclassified Peribacillus TaxID=2675266 RepID=UPI0039A19329
MFINSPFVSRKVETIDFKTFMKKEHRKKGSLSIKPIPVLAFIPLNPSAMIDPLFIAMAAGILLVALIEKGLADSDNVGMAAFISAFLRISFPIVGLSAIWFLVNQLSFFFR